MRTFLLIIKIVLITGAVLMAFVWLMAHASSHKIPLSTDLFFAGTAVGLLASAVLIDRLGSRLK